MTRVLTVFGTRPEAIKMAPVIRALRLSPGVECFVCVTGQHSEMLQQVIDLFEISVDVDLNVMAEAQTLTAVTTAILQGLEPVIVSTQPDWIVVHGDTTTSLAAALAASYQRVRVAHVEAGLRTGDIDQPWPEEINRTLVSRLATIHFAPTDGAKKNLLVENIDDAAIVVTGNTVIDALMWARETKLGNPAVAARIARVFSFLDASKRLLLVTGHRRENFDGGLREMCAALSTLAQRSDLQIIYPVHLNPAVRSVAHETLDGVENVHLTDPLDYFQFVWLMERADVIVSDSGGIQEEAPSLGVPVLVTRGATERPEAVEAGTARLVGTNHDVIVAEVSKLLDDDDHRDQMSQAANPFGDGRAAERIAHHLGTAP